MNDFTKDELVAILFWGIDRVEAIGLDEFKTVGHDIIYQKIHSLIDNYCEHDMDYESGEFHRCSKCGHKE